MKVKAKLITLYHRAAKKAANTVPCNYGCGTALPMGDEGRAARIAHFEACSVFIPNNAHRAHALAHSPALEGASS